MDANIFAKANQIIKKCDAAYFGVIDEDGFPSVSTVSVIKPENIFEAYFSTGLCSNKVKRIRKNKKVSLCCHAGGDIAERPPLFFYFRLHIGIRISVQHFPSSRQSSWARSS